MTEKHTALSQETLDRIWGKLPKKMKTWGYWRIDKQDLPEAAQIFMAELEPIIAVKILDEIGHYAETIPDEDGGPVDLICDEIQRKLKEAKAKLSKGEG